MSSVANLTDAQLRALSECITHGRIGQVSAFFLLIFFAFTHGYYCTGHKLFVFLLIVFLCSKSTVTCLDASVVLFVSLCPTLSHSYRIPRIVHSLFGIFLSCMIIPWPYGTRCTLLYEISAQTRVLNSLSQAKYVWRPRRFTLSSITFVVARYAAMATAIIALLPVRVTSQSYVWSSNRFAALSRTPVSLR